MKKEDPRERKYPFVLYLIQSHIHGSHHVNITQVRSVDENIQLSRSVKSSMTLRKQKILTSQEPVYKYKYHQTSNIRRKLVGNIVVHNSDVVGASPVGAAPTTSSLIT